jgi:putative mRNA 3-end processing factor
LPKNLTFVHEPETRARIIKESSVKVVLTTSGMGSHGPAQTYLPAFLQRKDALIHFTGYVTEGTLGRRIYDCPNDGVVSAGGISVKKNADVKFTSEFSGHAKANELIYFLAQFKNIKAVLINHGSYDSQLAYSKRVETELHPKSVGVLNSQYLFRVNAYGVTKQLTTKF